MMKITNKPMVLPRPGPPGGGAVRRLRAGRLLVVIIIVTINSISIIINITQTIIINIVVSVQDAS